MDPNFPFDFGLALTEEQAQQIPEVKEMIDNRPGWLQEWSEQVGAEIKDGLREAPSYIAFARENGTVYQAIDRRVSGPIRSPRRGSTHVGGETGSTDLPTNAPRVDRAPVKCQPMLERGHQISS